MYALILFAQYSSSSKLSASFVTQVTRKPEDSCELAYYTSLFPVVTKLQIEGKADKKLNHFPNFHKKLSWCKISRSHFVKTFMSYYKYIPDDPFAYYGIFGTRHFSTHVDISPNSTALNPPILHAQKPLVSFNLCQSK